MKEKHMRFGDFIRKKRLADSRELTQKDVAEHLGFTEAYIGHVENKIKKPFEGEKLQQLAEFLNMTDEEIALMYDLASREKREVPFDIEDTLMYEEVGELIRYATRQTRDGFFKEEDWKTFIRQKEEELKKQKEQD